MKKGSLINSINGITKYYQWQYISVNSSIIIDTEASTLLFKIVFCDKKLLLLNLDGTQEYCFLIDNHESGKRFISYGDIQWYLIRDCNIDMLSDKQRLEYNEEKKKKEEKRKLESEEEDDDENEKRQGLIFIWFYLLLLFFLILAFCAKRGS